MGVVLGLVTCDGKSLRLRFAIVVRPLSLQPLLFWKKLGFFSPQNNKGFSLRRTPKILGKGRENIKKTKEVGKQKSKEIKKKQGLEGQGPFLPETPTPPKT